MKATHLIGLKRYSWSIKSNPQHDPITCRSKDLNNEEIKGRQGSFYKPELLKEKQDIFRFDKVIWKDYKKEQALEKWLGCSDDFNSWIPLKDLQDLAN